MLPFVTLLSGTLFGLGLAISGMVDPARVTGFLDLAGAWDPGLGFVMGGALAVFLPGYLLWVRPRRQSLLGQSLPPVPAARIDARLLGGAALFGVGWGMVGICPGPGISLLASGHPLIVLFVAAMGAGLLLVDRLLVPRILAARA
ncbi:transporter [Aeromonas schubertii]|uniref:DUF6691 family protein n=1 Tax=Aeromonas schubertii TaxID=652 RepID=UPI00067EC6C6|nr:DUF6691 family protein [Aeromonas schubertii]KUE81808.1 transporter [Aeromonas schubertii]